MDEKRFQEACDYFCEQSGYDSIDDFINDYGYMIESIDDYFYEDNPKQGMDDLYWDTIGARHRIQRYKKRIGFEDEPITDPDDDEEDLIDRVEHEYRIVQKAETSGNFVSDYLIIDLKDDSRVYIPSSLEALKNIEIGACEETLAKVAVNKEGGLSVICSSYSGQIGEIDNLPNEIIDLETADFGVFKTPDNSYLVIDKTNPILVFIPNSINDIQPEIKIEKMEAKVVEHIQLEETDIVSIRVNGKEIYTQQATFNTTKIEPSVEEREINYEIKYISGNNEDGNYQNGIKIEFDNELDKPVLVHIKDVEFKGNVSETDLEIRSSTTEIIKNHNNPMHTIDYTFTLPNGEEVSIPSISGLANSDKQISEEVVSQGNFKGEPLWPTLISDEFDFEYVYNDLGDTAVERFSNYYKTGNMVSKFEKVDDKYIFIAVDLNKTDIIYRGEPNTPYNYFSVDKEPYNYRGAFTLENRFGSYLNTSGNLIGFKFEFNKINEQYPIIVLNSAVHKNIYYAPLVGNYAGALFDNFEEAALAARTNG